MKAKTKKTMLLAVPFAMSLGVGVAGASPDEKTAYCRVGNGKSVSYLDTLHACQKARAEGKHVTFIKAEPKKDAPK